jgi:hypothetical protein
VIISATAMSSSVRSFLHWDCQLTTEARGLLGSRQIANELKRVACDLEVEWRIFLSVWVEAETFAASSDILMKDSLPSGGYLRFRGLINSLCTQPFPEMSTYLDSLTFQSPSDYLKHVWRVQFFASINCWWWSSELRRKLELWVNTSHCWKLLVQAH